MLASRAHLFIKFLLGDRISGLAHCRDRVAPILHFHWLWRTLRGNIFIQEGILRILQTTSRRATCKINFFRKQIFFLISKFEKKMILKKKEISKFKILILKKRIFKKIIYFIYFKSQVLKPRTYIVASGHTATNTPDLFRTPKLTVAGPCQYWGGGPPGKPFGCC